jgi:hypothetical protein
MSIEAQIVDQRVRKVAGDRREVFAETCTRPLTAGCRPQWLEWREAAAKL